jgi:hypothetical protein
MCMIFKAAVRTALPRAGRRSSRFMTRRSRAIHPHARYRRVHIIAALDGRDARSIRALISSVAIEGAGP